MKRNLLVILIAFSWSAFSQTPYAYYPLDGNAIDVSGHNLNGTITGLPTATTNRYNQSAKALNFNGTTDYIELPSDFDFPNRTVIVWFYASSVGSANSENLVYSNDNPTLQNGFSAIYAFYDGIGSTIHIQSDNITYYAAINLNTWYQAAVVRTPAYVNCYLNGVLVYTGSNPNGLHSNNSLTNNAVVGADRGYLAKFIGKIDDLRIYDSALPDSAIVNNYNSIKTIHDIDNSLQLTTQSGNVFFHSAGNIPNNIKSASIFDIEGKLINEKNNLVSGSQLNDAALCNGVYVAAFYIDENQNPICRKFIIAN